MTLSVEPSKFICTTCAALASQAGACHLGHGPLTKVTSGNLIGSHVGNFVIVEYVAGGGMGEVFRAVQPTLQVDVAIKLMPASLAKDARMAQRMILEAQAANRVPHAGVVKVTDAGVVDGRPYFVMELLRGSTLAQWSASRTICAPAKSIDIVCDMLDILAAAHRAQVVHRDLKPSNVFITTAGVVKLLDFGLARMLDRKTRFTAHGSMLGTPSYMAPEQITGVDADHRADLYATGVILFELLTQQHPFDTTSDFTVLDGHMNVPAPLVNSVGGSVAPAIEAVVAKALAKDPAQRFADADAMRQALRAASGVAMPLPQRVPSLAQPQHAEPQRAEPPHAEPRRRDAAPQLATDGAGASSRSGKTAIIALAASSLLAIAAGVGVALYQPKGAPTVTVAKPTPQVLVAEAVPPVAVPTTTRVPANVATEPAPNEPGNLVPKAPPPPPGVVVPKTPPPIKPVNSKPSTTSKPNTAKPVDAIALIANSRPVDKTPATPPVKTAPANTLPAAPEPICSTVGGTWAKCGHAACDVNLKLDNNHCGACGKRCPAEHSCINAVCKSDR